MMVVHEDGETPVEVPVIRKPLLEHKSYVIVKNHVRELINTEESKPIKTNNEESRTSEESVEKKSRKSDKKLKRNEQMPTASVKYYETNNERKIDQNDLQELRSVYVKCREVMRKIESKYGHLLDLESEAGPSSCKKRKLYTDEFSEEECDCKLNRKIVFDDDGKQSTVETVSEKHICVRNMKKIHSSMKTRSKNIAIEYTENEINLPDNLQELGSLLQDPDIDKYLRNRIIYKIKSLKQDYVNDIRFNKHSLIEKLKVNPDEVLAFKGTNLSTIPGYL